MAKSSSKDLFISWVLNWPYLLFFLNWVNTNNKSGLNQESYYCIKDIIFVISIFINFNVLFIETLIIKNSLLKLMFFDIDLKEFIL